MLRLYLGRAGSGKTSFILGELRDLAEKGIGGSKLIVPEQYSHDCERALAAMGDSLCLYAEALSFTRLTNRVFAETGGMADRTMDAGGRMLAMSRAYMAVSSHLKVYDVGGRRPDFIKDLISAYDELRDAGVDAGAASELANGSLADKLADLALIFEAYETVKERSGADPRDRLERLAEDIGRSSVGSTGRIYVDGFTDFTHQESRVIEELIKKGADVTVALNCPDLGCAEQVFEIPVRTAQSLLRMAKDQGSETCIREFPAKTEGDGALRYMERHLFDYSAPVYGGDTSGVRVIHAGSLSEECAAAAARCLELVRSGCRFRDIAVVSPRWEAYSAMIRGVFSRYGVPMTSTERSDILDKPVMSLIVSALDIINNNWDYVNVFRYLKTDLAGMTLEERDILENYCLKWNIRGQSMWTRREGWTMHPGGYSEEMDDGEAEELRQINELRLRAAGPLMGLKSGLESGGSALEKVRAVYGFLENIGLYGLLTAKADELTLAGRGELAAEYRQLWDILMDALQQFADILGGTELGTDEFIRLLRLVLSQYTVGVIPTSVDSVRTGDMGRIRARGIGHLIVLGATDDALPVRRGDGGVFSDAEREEMAELGLETMGGRDRDLARELMGVYSALTVPSRSLTLTYPEPSRRSYIIARLTKLFDIEELTPGEDVYAAAEGPCFELAVSGDGELSREALAYFDKKPEWSRKLEAVERAVSLPRGRLTNATARRLYGGRLRLSASQVDKYYSCRYAYFLQYGLRARPRTEAALDAPEAGTFMHFVLERTAREAQSRGGFAALDEVDIRTMIPAFVREYAEKRLGGTENKSGRFKYLLTRLARAAADVAVSMWEELRQSDFTPMDFELRFAPDGDLPPVEIGRDVTVVGAVDRVDGWVSGGKLWLRVVDYKTGKKSMDLRDIVSGIGLQMLIYLFALEREGRDRYGMEIAPAGVLYVPARDTLVSSVSDMDDASLEKERARLIKYSGLIVADSEVIEAMEHGSKKRLPVTVVSKTGEIKGGVASAERLGRLGRRVDGLIMEMAKELREGNIAADPYLRGRTDSACVFCKFYEACHFKDGQGGESYRRLTSLKTPELWEIIDREDGQ